MNLDAKVSVLEERMNTRQAEYKTDIAQLGKQIAESREESARRETRLIAFIVGVAFGIVAVLGAMIGLHI